MRPARIATLLVALTLLVAADSRAASWTAPATLASCAPASDPKVVFPSSYPSKRSGRGAILWLGGAPDCSGAGVGSTATLDSATLHSDDRPSVPRVLVRGEQLVGPLEAAGTSVGQLVAVAGDASSPAGGRPGALLAEGPAGGVLHRLSQLGGPNAPLATADGYIGDADVVSTETALGGPQLIVLREQRHFAHSFTRLVTLEEGFAPITALAVGMDFRADSVVLWAQGGEVHAQWVTNYGRAYPPQVLGPAGYAPQLAAVLSDNDHAFAMWTEEPPPGAAGEATIYLEHSANNVTFPAQPRILAQFNEPAEQRLTPGAIALVRQTPSEGVLAAWTLIAGANFVVEAAGLTATTVLPATTIAAPGSDLRLAALATGPKNDFVAVLESAPRSADGFDYSQQAILATRSVPGGPGGVAFAAPTQLAPAGPNSAPSVAIDPDTDRAVVAWQTMLDGVPAVAYAVRNQN
jgi:hypothetical protein